MHYAGRRISLESTWQEFVHNLSRGQIDAKTALTFMLGELDRAEEQQKLAREVYQKDAESSELYEKASFREAQVESLLIQGADGILF
jgi:hypothetical protein